MALPHSKDARSDRLCRAGYTWDRPCFADKYGSIFHPQTLAHDALRSKDEQMFACVAALANVLVRFCRGVYALVRVDDVRSSCGRTGYEALKAFVEARARGEFHLSIRLATLLGVAGELKVQKTAPGIFSVKIEFNGVIDDQETQRLSALMVEFRKACFDEEARSAP